MTKYKECKGRRFYSYCEIHNKYHEVEIIKENTPIDPDITDGVSSK